MEVLLDRMLNHEVANLEWNLTYISYLSRLTLPYFSLPYLRTSFYCSIVIYFSVVRSVPPNRITRGGVVKWHWQSIDLHSSDKRIWALLGRIHSEPSYRSYQVSLT